MRPQTNNHLLRSLSPSDYRRLAPHLHVRALPAGAVLYEADDPVETVWFPEAGLISMISVMISGTMVESSMVGCEGGVGYLEACGVRTMFSRCVIQVEGSFAGVPAGAFRRAHAQSEAFRTTIASHVELLLTEARQMIACHTLHDSPARLAWLLLEVQDRLGGLDRFGLTQEYLGVMLGVRRSTVSTVALALQAEGTIRYTRGKIEILDRPALEARSCECYATTQRFRRLIEEPADALSSAS